MKPIHFSGAARLKAKPQDESNLAFGKIFTDHMFTMNYHIDKGWYDAQIVPYAPIELDPAAICLHYGQLIFEGMKAYRADDGRVLLFRPKSNMQRLNASGDRLCIPPVDVDFMVEAVAKLVSIDKDWIPKQEGTSLYIRPFIIATESSINLHPSESYMLMVILSPVGHVFSNGFSPIKIFVEDEYARAVEGGAGFAKCAGNYAATLAPQMKAHKAGYSQVLWLDGKQRKYVDEAGPMNVFFVVDGKVITPELNGSILSGITRDSVITMLRSWGVSVEERKVAISELADAAKAGKFDEAFGAGTAVVIAPIGELKWGDTIMRIGDGNVGAVTRRLYDNLTGIQCGSLPDDFGWTYEVH